MFHAGVAQNSISGVAQFSVVKHIAPETQGGANKGAHAWYIINSEVSVL